MQTAKVEYLFRGWKIYVDGDYAGNNYENEYPEFQLDPEYYDAFMDALKDAARDFEDEVKGDYCTCSVNWCDGPSEEYTIPFSDSDICVWITVDLDGDGYAAQQDDYFDDYVVDLDTRDGVSHFVGRQESIPEWIELDFEFDFDGHRVRYELDAGFAVEDFEIVD